MIPGFTAAQAPKRSHRALIVGQVIDTAGTPLAGARVDVWSESGETAHAYADEAGRYGLLLRTGADRFAMLARSIGMAPARFTLERTPGTMRLIGDVQLLPVGRRLALSATPRFRMAAP